MTSDPLFLVYSVGILVLVVGALVARREPLGKLAKMALIWIGIFGLGFVAFTFRSDVGYVVDRLKAEATGAPIVDGETLRIAKSIDGHFYVDAEVNGATVNFMVDSGATVTTLGRSAAQAAGIATGGQPDVLVQTANGTVGMFRSRARDFDVGPIERNNMRVHVAQRDDLNVIGMNWLSSLQSWSVEGDWLVLNP